MKNILRSFVVSVGFGLLFALVLGLVAKLFNYHIDTELLAMSAAMVTGLVSGMHRRILQLKSK